LKGKVIILSGYGNVAWGVCLKARDLGSKVISISGRAGYIHDPQGINTDEKIDFLLRIRGENSIGLADYAKKFNVEFYPNEKPWNLKGDIAFPSATENEIDLEEAKALHKNGVKYVFEGNHFVFAYGTSGHVSIVISRSKFSDHTRSYAIFQGKRRHPWSSHSC
jgi:glutamate dehydrogenase (NADP+)